MSPEQRQHLDPLVVSIKLLLEKESEQDWGPVLTRLANDIAHTRQRPVAGRFTNREDPIKLAVTRILSDERIVLAWDRLVILGCSAGGDVALRTLFGHINYPHVPIIIAMHHHPGFKFIAGFELANGLTQKPVLVQTDMAIKSGEVYFAPGDMTLGYHRSNASFQLSTRTIKSRFRPIIDQVFSAAAVRFSNRLTGAIMSGMLSDGAQGLKDIFLGRGEALIQIPDTALFGDMPKAAAAAVPTARTLTLQQLAGRINEHSGQYLRARSYKPASRWAAS